MEAGCPPPPERQFDNMNERLHQSTNPLVECKFGALHLALVPRLENLRVRKLDFIFWLQFLKRPIPGNS